MPVLSIFPRVPMFYFDTTQKCYFFIYLIDVLSLFISLFYFVYRQMRDVTIHSLEEENKASTRQLLVIADGRNPSEESPGPRDFNKTCGIANKSTAPSPHHSHEGIAHNRRVGCREISKGKTSE